jgi:hypothetical protein
MHVHTTATFAGLSGTSNLLLHKKEPPSSCLAGQESMERLYMSGCYLGTQQLGTHSIQQAAGCSCNQLRSCHIALINARSHPSALLPVLPAWQMINDSIIQSKG